jgi:hypothetical protein
MAGGDALGDLPGDADLGGMAGALREEWRAEEEEYARAAAAQWGHGRRLVDVARELMHRGDTVAVTAGDLTFSGQIVYVGVDLLQLQTADGGALDVQLALLTTAREGTRESRVAAPVVLRVVERARSGGRRPGPAADTFRARLLEHEADGVEVVLGSVLLREELRGTLTVGRDQVRVCDPGGAETYLPLAWVGWVMRRRD